eukprot:3937911-Rhodomonas_salina.1
MLASPSRGGHRPRLVTASRLTLNSFSFSFCCDHWSRDERQRREVPHHCTLCQDTRKLDLIRCKHQQKLRLASDLEARLPHAGNSMLDKPKKH